MFQCVFQLCQCLLAEVQEKSETDFFLAKRLCSAISFFVYDLVSVVDPPQVFELVRAY